MHDSQISGQFINMYIPFIWILIAINSIYSCMEIGISNENGKLATEKRRTWKKGVSAKGIFIKVWPLSKGMLNQQIIYTLPSFCFHQCLHNKYLVPKLRPFTSRKNVQIICPETPSLPLWMITLKNCTRCPKYSWMKKKCRHLIPMFVFVRVKFSRLSIWIVFHWQVCSF